jgi:hypothetical protein
MTFQPSLPEPEPLVEVATEQSRQDAHENLLVYIKQEMTEPPMEETKVYGQELKTLSPNFAPQIDSSKMPEHPRQEISPPSPPFSPNFNFQKRVESPKPEVVGASSFFSARLDSQKAGSFKPNVPVSSPQFMQQVDTTKPTQSINQEVSVCSPHFWTPSYAPKAADTPNKESSGATDSYPRAEAEKPESPTQAPAPRFSPPSYSPQIAVSPKQDPSAAPYFPQQVEAHRVETPIHAPSPRFPTAVNSSLIAQSPKQASAPSPTILARTNPFRTSDSPKQDFAVPSNRFTPQLSAPTPPSIYNSKPRLESPINGFGAALKEDARKRSREREKQGPVQEGVKVSPSPVPSRYSPSKEFQQSRVVVTPRTSTPGEEEVKRISTNSPLPAQKFRMLARERGSDSEREGGERAPSVISNLSIDEMLMDMPHPQPQSTKEARKNAVDAKGKEQKDNSNGHENGNGTANVSQTTTEAEDVWTPPKTFKMKKSKKTFSTRY